MNQSTTLSSGWLAREGKMAKTIGYYAAFVALGLIVAAIGPTINGLAANTGSTLSQISYLFLLNSSGYLLGSILAGRLYDRRPGHPLMIAAFALVIATLIVIPLITSLPLLIAVILLLGLGEGLLDVGGNTLLVWVHSNNVGPYMNALHFFFGVGAVFSPLLAGQVQQATGGVAWVYWTMALTLVPVLLWVARLPSPPLLHHSEAAAARAPINYRLLGLLVLFFFLFVGVEVSYSGWIFNYAVAMGLGNASSAAYLNSVFWIAFTVGRLIGIPIASWFRPRTILLVDLLVCLLSVAIVLIWPQSAAVLWLGIIGAGLGMASLFAVTLSWAERRLHITGFITSCFFIGSSLGGMFFPWFIGQLFESSGPLVTMLTILVCDVAALAVFVVLMIYGGPPRTQQS